MNSRLLIPMELYNDGFYTRMAEISMHSDVEDIVVDAYHRTMLELAVKLATPGYTCLRPPGAAGALLDTLEGVLLGCAEPPTGLTCKEIGACEMEDGHCVRTIHAEVNAIALAAKHGCYTKNRTMYSILKPCYNCTKIIIAAGITTIVYAGMAYDEPRTKHMLEAASVRAIHIDVGLEYGNGS